MKTLRFLRPSLAIFIFAALAAILPVACVSTKTTTTNPDGTTTTITKYTADTNAVKAITGVLKIGVKQSCRLAMQKDANAVAYLQAADVVLSAALDNGTYSASTLREALNTVSVREVRDNPTVKDMVADVLELVSAAEGDALSRQIDKVVWLRPSLTAVRDGIHSALATR